jgi:hypothetical protein
MIVMGGLIVQAPAVAAEQAGDFTYTVGGSPMTATVTGYSGSNATVTIPATLGGYPVSTIGQNAFNGATSITSLSMPDTVTVIEQQAFYACGYMTSITLSKNLTTIGGWAFDHCQFLTSITIPAKVTTISEYAFQQCNSLNTVNFEGMVAPTSVADTWFGGPNSARGHSYASSNFPSPGNDFHGLKMGVVLSTAPSAPTQLLIMVGNGQAALTWNAPSDGGSPITYYRVYRAASESGSYSPLSSPTSPSYTDTGLTSGQTYWYKVTAVNAIGESVASQAAGTTVPGPDNTMVYVVIIVIIVAIAAVAIVYLVRRRNE